MDSNRNERIIRLNTEHDTLYIIERGIQRQVVGSERLALLATLANASAMTQQGAWATFSVSAGA